MRQDHLQLALMRWGAHPSSPRQSAQSNPPLLHSSGVALNNGLLGQAQLYSRDKNAQRYAKFVSILQLLECDLRSVVERSSNAKAVRVRQMYQYNMFFMCLASGGASMERNTLIIFPISWGAFLNATYSQIACKLDSTVQEPKAYEWCRFRALLNLSSQNAGRRSGLCSSSKVKRSASKAVVLNMKQLHTAILDGDLNGKRPGVKAVFRQLF
ncbi:uncharacterized protein F5891DRAFT_975773 [Suillus fuscotomentosus]|uniref:Uncharacterized protein n=1 Tax=Suillus fuscotomentosus TaxID=1912939 RepID=A0AAD4EHX7_9AGAM|nr:uncharacterized protein F5891DRAFT_975773 [Suillus fuscotomentosus]KAG1906381.1 hypothetical protein F5891DRAFT_975773 [Suillus fuscotomentosus]